MTDKEKTKTDWSKPDENGTIDIPDELVPIMNRVMMQLRFLTISRKNDVLTAAHIVQAAEEFFTGVKYE